MPKGTDSSNDPRRRPKVVDLDHYRRTREIKDVNEQVLYDYTAEEEKASKQDNQISVDTDPTPYQGTPRPWHPSGRDFIDRSPENKTIMEKMWDKTLGKVIDEQPDDE